MKKTLFVILALLLLSFLIFIINGYNPLRSSKNYPPYGVTFEKRYERIVMSSYPWTWEDQEYLKNTLSLSEYSLIRYAEVYSATEMNVYPYDDDIFFSKEFIAIKEDCYDGNFREVRFYYEKRKDDNTRMVFKTR